MLRRAAPRVIVLLLPLAADGAAEPVVTNPQQ